MSNRSWIKVGSGGGGSGARQGGSVTRVFLIFVLFDGVLCDLIRVLL